MLVVIVIIPRYIIRVKFFLSCSGGPLCFVDFHHYARFAEWWLETGTGLPADLYEDEDNTVNWLDLGVFANHWLVGK
ncbi:MAG: hypothetical protein ACYS8Y_00525 [Planctomycetota bacterium]|jgi:hypothetical protein